MISPWLSKVTKKHPQWQAVQEALFPYGAKRPETLKKGHVGPLLLAPAPAPEVVAQVARQACLPQNTGGEGGQKTAGEGGEEWSRKAGGQGHWILRTSSPAIAPARLTPECVLVYFLCFVCVWPDDSGDGCWSKFCYPLSLQSFDLP